MSKEPPNFPRVTGGPYRQAGLRDVTRRQFFQAVKTLRSLDSAGEGDGSEEFSIRVVTPSSQVRVLISVNFEPAAGQPDDIDITSWGNTIWLAATDDAVGGASTQDVPNSSVVGTRSAPRPFPSTITAGVAVLDNGLLGFSREFVTASPAITGRVVCGSGTGGTVAPGGWILRASWQPDGVVLPDDAWKEITSLCRIEAFEV